MSAGWENNLANDARKFRNLLHDVDQCSEALWFDHNYALSGARYRYTDIFLPIYAAHLDNVGAIKLEGNVKKRFGQIIQLAKKNLGAAHINAAKYAQDWGVSDGQQLALFMAPFKRIPKGASPAQIQPIPPIDVAFLWVIHRLDPKQYEKDCIEMFGCPLPVINGGISYVSASNDTEMDSLVSRLQWTCFAQAIARTRKKSIFASDNNYTDKTFLPTYLWPRFAVGDHENDDADLKCFPAAPWKSSWAKQRSTFPPIDFDFVAAAEKLRVFAYNVSSTYYDETDSLLRGVYRYKKYVELIKSHPEESLVPLYDIDLIWHARILQPTGMEEDEHEITVARFVQHQDPKEYMDKYLKRTAELWDDAYGNEYYDENTGYQGRLKHRSEFRVFNQTQRHIIRANKAKMHEFVMSVVDSESRTKKRMVDMNLQCQNKVFKAAGIRRFSQIEGGACAGMYCEGYITREAVAQIPGGKSGNPKIGAGVHRGSTPMGPGALLVFVGVHFLN